MTPASDRHRNLVAHIQSARAALRTITDLSQRKTILEELAAATEELAELSIKRKTTTD